MLEYRSQADPDDGQTNVADGILLCRHHQMSIQNNHWRIRLQRAEYVLLPPRERDPNQTPIPMPAEGPALTDSHRHKRTG